MTIEKHSKLGALFGESRSGAALTIRRMRARSSDTQPVPGAKWGARGRYIINRRLGATATGIVYEATDTLLGRNIALKPIHRDSASDAEANSSRRVGEGLLAAQVDGDLFPLVYDMDEHCGLYFVTMEIVGGTTLRSLIGTVRSITDRPFRGGPKSIRWYNTRLSRCAGQLALSVAGGLVPLHEHSIGHGHVKPENILISNDCAASILADGEADTVSLDAIKLLDFDLDGYGFNECRELVRPNPDSRSRASTVPFSKTPGYVAPECNGGYSPYPGGDVFALGVILYEVVTGTLPFNYENPFALRAWRDRPDLRDLVERMVAPDPKRRFADANEVMNAVWTAPFHKLEQRVATATDSPIPPAA